MIISFFVNCAPVPQPRQRHTIVDDIAIDDSSGFPKAYTVGKIHNYTPKKHKVNVFKTLAKIAAKQAYQGNPLQGPLRLSLLFLLPRPQRLVWKSKPMIRTWAPTKPDRDNLEKSLNDALKGIIWVDDSQVCDGPVQKMYAAGGESPGVVVEIEELS